MIGDHMIIKSLLVLLVGCVCLLIIDKFIKKI